LHLLLPLLLLTHLLLLLLLHLLHLLLPSQLSSNLLCKEKNHRQVVFFSPETAFAGSLALLLQFVRQHLQDALCIFRYDSGAFSIENTYAGLAFLAAHRNLEFGRLCVFGIRAEQFSEETLF
jgi:hypothetical protein